MNRDSKRHRRLGGWACFIFAFGFSLFVIERHTAYIERFLSEAISPPPQRLAAAIELREGAPILEKPLIEADAYFWINHVLNTEQTRHARLRWTIADNTPAGREVWWNSGLVWMAKGFALLNMAVTGNDFKQAVWSTAPYVNTVLLAIVVIGVGLCVMPFGGFPAACVTMILFPMAPRIMWDFSFSRFDHHGQHTALFLAAAMAFSAGHAARAKSARSLCFTLGGVATGCGLWVGATQQIVLTFLLVVGGAIDLILHRRQRAAGTVDDPPWGRWGIAAAVTALALYLIENAPDRMLQLRFEVNHPIYAVMVGSAGAALALLGKASNPRRRRRSVWLGLAACLAAPMVYFLGLGFLGEEVHRLREPMMRRAHDLILEFMPFFRLYPGDATRALLEQIGVIFLVPPLALCALLLGLLPLSLRRAVVVLLPAMAMLPIITFLQARWAGLASASCLLGFAFLACAFFRPWPDHSLSPMKTWIGRLGIAGVAIATVTLWVLELDRRERSAIGFAYSTRGAAMTLARDVTLNLRLLRTQGTVRVLADPDAAPWLVGVGHVPCVGSYYWENLEGIRDTAQSFAATSEDAMRSVVVRRGITHVLLPGDAKFASDMLWIARGIRDERLALQTLAARLIEQRDVPRWLRPVEYYATLREGARVWRLYEVVPPLRPE